MRPNHRIPTWIAALVGGALAAGVAGVETAQAASTAATSQGAPAQKSTPAKPTATQPGAVLSGPPAVAILPPVRTLQCNVLAICPTHFITLGGLRSNAMSVAAGGNSVWALDDQGRIYRFNAAAQVFDAMPGALTSISVGGGDLVVEDEVWGLNAQRQIFQWASFKNNWIGVAGPAGALVTALAVGRGHDVDNCHPSEVWALTADRQAFRFAYCQAAWQAVAGPPITAISAKGGEVWALDNQGAVYRFDPNALTFTQVPGTLSSLTVGVDGIWGTFAPMLNPEPVNAAGAAARAVVVNPLAPSDFQYDPATRKMVQIPNAQMTAIAAGASGVWATNASLAVYRLQAMTRKFLPITPTVALRSIAVGDGTGVWGIDTSFHIRAFVTPARAVRETNLLQ